MSVLSELRYVSFRNYSACMQLVLHVIKWKVCAESYSYLRKTSGPHKIIRQPTWGHNPCFGKHWSRLLERDEKVWTPTITGGRLWSNRDAIWRTTIKRNVSNFKRTDRISSTTRIGTTEGLSCFQNAILMKHTLLSRSIINSPLWIWTTLIHLFVWQKKIVCFEHAPTHFHGICEKF